MLPTLLQGLLLAGALPASTPAPYPVRVYSGRANQLAVHAPRLEAHARVDGALDEPPWSEAALLTGFSQYYPVDGRAATDSTEVLIWYTAHELYIGIRAYERHGTVHATLADRDRIGADDYVQILLDTFRDHRRALVFGVNPLGVQADGTWTEGVGSGDQGSDAQLDLNPDFVFESKGRLEEWGYQVELRIPFKSIRYQPDRVQTWGINIKRHVQHNGYQETWAPALQGRSSFLAQSGTLEQLTDLRRGLVLDMNPVTTGKLEGSAGPGGWRYGQLRPELGGNLRWGITANLTMNGTVNPDFSQVEADAGQLVYDPRQTLFFPEKRPFFLEANENFDTPNRLIYTRRVVNPVGALKFTGKVSGTTVGFLSAVDDAALSVNGTDHPVVNLLRVRRDLGDQSTLGMVYTDREVGADYNRVLAADTRLQLGPIYTLQVQAGGSFTREAAWSSGLAPLWDVAAVRSGRSLRVTAQLQGRHEDFRAAAGYLSRVGIVHAYLNPVVTSYGRAGTFIETWSKGITLDGTWRYHRFVRGEGAEDLKLHLNSTWQLRGGWHAGVTAYIESFKYPPELYTDYAIERHDAVTGVVLDTVPFVGTNRIPNLDFSLSINTPQFRSFSARAFLIGGRDENFAEWAPGYVFLGDMGLSWRPTEKTRLEATYINQSYVRPSDHSLVSARHIPRLKVEYQLSRPIFLRFVGQYDAARQDSLRDDSRTYDPILLRQPDGSYVRAAGFRTGTFRGDVLFSYRPGPGTVIYAGYGSTLQAADDLSPRAFRHTDNGLFLKLSYLFRM